MVETVKEDILERIELSLRRLVYLIGAGVIALIVLNWSKVIYFCEWLADK